MSRNTTIIASVAVAAVTIVAATVLAKARSGADPRIDATTTASLKTLRRTRPSGGRHTRRRDPLADGHATPAAGLNSVRQAPKYFTYGR